MAQHRGTSGNKLSNCGTSRVSLGTPDQGLLLCFMVMVYPKSMVLFFTICYTKSSSKKEWSPASFERKRAEWLRDGEGLETERLHFYRVAHG